MFKYILKRILVGLFTLFVLATITFFLMKIIPGSPFAGGNINAEVKAQLMAKYNLDKPVLDQYMIYIRNAFVGDFGISTFSKGVKVTDVIAKGFPTTMRLGFVAFAISMTVGIGLGILSAFSKKKWVSNLVIFLSTIGVSTPSFLMAILLMMILGAQLNWFPIIGLSTARHYFLPALSLSFYPISMISRLTRSSLQEVMKQDYMVLAKSKGTSQLKVILKHGLRNAMIPVITYAGPLIAILLTGSFVIETLFSIPGIGAEYVMSITNRDYTMIMGMTILFGAFVILGNILSDIINALVDPRIKLSK